SGGQGLGCKSVFNSGLGRSSNRSLSDGDELRRRTLWRPRRRAVLGPLLVSQRVELGPNGGGRVVGELLGDGRQRLPPYRTAAQRDFGLRDFRASSLGGSGGGSRRLGATPRRWGSPAPANAGLWTKGARSGRLSRFDGQSSASKCSIARAAAS